MPSEIPKSSPFQAWQTALPSSANSAHDLGARLDQLHQLGEAFRNSPNTQHKFEAFATTRGQQKEYQEALQQLNQQVRGILQEVIRALPQLKAHIKQAVIQKAAALMVVVDAISAKDLTNRATRAALQSLFSTANASAETALEQLEAQVMIDLATQMLGAAATVVRDVVLLNSQTAEQLAHREDPAQEPSVRAHLTQALVDVGGVSRTLDRVAKMVKDVRAKGPNAGAHLDTLSVTLGELRSQIEVVRNLVVELYSKSVSPDVNRVSLKPYTEEKIWKLHEAVTDLSAQCQGIQKALKAD